MNTTKTPVFLVAMGDIDIYHFQTEKDFYAKNHYTEVFWRNRKTQDVAGPFPSVYEACLDYAAILKYEKKYIRDGKVLNVDFRTKTVKNRPKYYN